MYEKSADHHIIAKNWYEEIIQFETCTLAVQIYFIDTQIGTRNNLFMRKKTLLMDSSYLQDQYMLIFVNTHEVKCLTNKNPF